MSRLADPHFEEIYAICNDITENSCEDDPLLESDVESMVSKFQMLQVLTNKISVEISQYDSKTGTKANGYRSLIRVVGTLVRHCIELYETIKHQISTLGYVGSDVREDLLTWSSVVERLINILELAVEIKSSTDQLYPDKPDCQSAQVYRLSQKEDMDVTPFYGSALGFHLGGDSRRMMHPLATSMACLIQIFMVAASLGR